MQYQSLSYGGGLPPQMQGRGDELRESQSFSSGNPLTQSWEMASRHSHSQDPMGSQSQSQQRVYKQAPPQQWNRLTCVAPVSNRSSTDELLQSVRHKEVINMVEKLSKETALARETMLRMELLIKELQGSVNDLSRENQHLREEVRAATITANERHDDSSFTTDEDIDTKDCMIEDESEYGITVTDYLLRLNASTRRLPSSRQQSPSDANNDSLLFSDYPPKRVITSTHISQTQTTRVTEEDTQELRESICRRPPFWSANSKKTISLTLRSPAAGAVAHTSKRRIVTSLKSDMHYY
jgi:hypothetical protein